MTSSSDLPSVHPLSMRRICGAVCRPVKLCLSLSLPPTTAGPMPRLSHRDFKVRGFAEPTNFIKVVLLELPLLRMAILNDIAASWVVLPWAQLTSLTLRRVLPQEWIPILQQTSNLVHCDLRLYPIYRRSPEIPDITLPHLESLIMVETDPNAGIRISRYCTFIVPALRSLQIPGKSLRESPIDALALFMSKLGYRLEKVCITGQKISITKASYLQAFPALSKVSLRGCYAKDLVGRNIPTFPTANSFLKYFPRFLVCALGFFCLITYNSLSFLVIDENINKLVVEWNFTLSMRNRLSPGYISLSLSLCILFQGIRRLSWPAR